MHWFGRLFGNFLGGVIDGLWEHNEKNRRRNKKTVPCSNCLQPVPVKWTGGVIPGYQWKEPRCPHCGWSALDDISKH